MANKTANKKTNKNMKKSASKNKTVTKKKVSLPKKAAAGKKVASKKATSKRVASKKVPSKKVASQKSKVKLAAKPARNATALLKPMKPVKAKDYSRAFTPLADRLVVRVVENEKITAGGIIIPDSAAMVQGHIKGEVLAVGNGAKNKKGQVRPLDVQLGDYVLFAQYSGTKIEFNSEELQIVKESDIMGIVQK